MPTSIWHIRFKRCSSLEHFLRCKMRRLTITARLYGEPNHIKSFGAHMRSSLVVNVVLIYISELKIIDPRSEACEIGIPPAQFEGLLLRRRLGRLYYEQGFSLFSEQSLFTLLGWLLSLEVRPRHSSDLRLRRDARRAAGDCRRAKERRAGATLACISGSDI